MGPSWVTWGWHGAVFGHVGGHVWLVLGLLGGHDGPILGLLGSHITQRVLDRNVWLVQSYLLQYSTLLRVLDMLKGKAVPKEKKASCWPNSSPGKGLSTSG